MENPANKSMRAMSIGGKRAGIRLEPETWAAIDMLAAKKGLKWQEWAAQKLGTIPDVDNVTGAIRIAAMEEMLHAMAAESSFSPPEGLQHPLLGLVTAIDRDTLVAELKNAHIDYAVDMGAFVLHAGTRNFGGFALFIENKLIGELSLVMSEDE